MGIAVRSAALFAVSEVARASIIATLVFTAPTAPPIAPTASVPLQVTLTLDPASDPIATDDSGQVASITSAQIAANLFPDLPAGVDIATDVLSSRLNENFGCSGTFTSSCTVGPPYDFTFENGPGGWGVISPSILLAGQSYDFRVGTFTPTGGVAPAGNYEFFFTSFFAQVFDLNFLDDPSDLSSGPLLIAEIPIADTVSSGSPTFERTVAASVPVPETGTFAMVVVGWALVAMRRRDRSPIASTASASNCPVECSRAIAPPPSPQVGSRGTKAYGRQ